MSAKRQIETTEAQRRKIQLEYLTCVHCATRGLWHVRSTRDRVRHLKCKGCGTPAKLALPRPLPSPPDEKKGGDRPGTETA